MLAARRAALARPRSSFSGAVARSDQHFDGLGAWLQALLHAALHQVFQPDFVGDQRLMACAPLVKVVLGNRERRTGEVPPMSTNSPRTMIMRSV